MSWYSTAYAPRNALRSRAIAHDIFQLKTSGGTRGPYFFDEHRLVICSEAMTKQKKRGLTASVERAARDRRRCLSDKRRGALRVVEDP